MWRETKNCCVLSSEAQPSVELSSVALGMHYPSAAWVMEFKAAENYLHMEIPTT